MKQIKTKHLLIVFTLIFIGIQGLFISYWYNKTLDDTGNSAMSISQVVASAIDVEKYEDIVVNKNKNNYFVQMQRYFKQVQQETGVKYLYVEHKISDDKIEYIFDAEGNTLGDVDENSTPEAHLSKKKLSTRVQQTQLWGTLITGYVPLINKKGEIVGAVGTDIDVNFFYKELKNRVINILLYSLAMIIIFCVLVYLSLKNEMNERRLAEKNLEKTTVAIRNILDNAGQGFFTFGSNFIINPVYSEECESIFGNDFSKRTFQKLLFPNDKQQSDFLKDVLLEVFAEKDDMKKDIFVSLLPDQVSIHNKYLKMQYKIIESKYKTGQKEIMVIASDETEKMLLETQMEAERIVLKRIVQAVVFRDELNEQIKDYENFCSKDLWSKIDDFQSLQNGVSELFKIVHTFKGTFSQLKMHNVSEKLHDLESDLSNEEKFSSNKQLREHLIKLNMLAWIEPDLRIIKSKLGEKFLVYEQVFEEHKLAEFEINMKDKLTPDDYEILLKETNCVRYKPFKQLLKSYPEFVTQLAEKLGKYIDPLVIEGSDIEVDINKYKPFAKSLIHVFINAVDHGMEMPEERLEKGKNESGALSCKIEVKDKFINLIIQDNGKGIDSKKIKDHAIHTELLTAAKAANMSEEEILHIIFMERYSTKDIVNAISGRGIGLTAVKEELDKLAGFVNIETQVNVGTSFSFFLPLEERGE